MPWSTSEVTASGRSRCAEMLYLAAPPGFRAFGKKPYHRDAFDYGKRSHGNQIIPLFPHTSGLFILIRGLSRFKLFATHICTTFCLVFFIARFLSVNGLPGPACFEPFATPICAVFCLVLFVAGFLFVNWPPGLATFTKIRGGGSISRQTYGPSRQRTCRTTLVQFEALSSTPEVPQTKTEEYHVPSRKVTRHHRHRDSAKISAQPQASGPSVLFSRPLVSNAVGPDPLSALDGGDSVFPSASSEIRSAPSEINPLQDVLSSITVLAAGREPLVARPMRIEAEDIGQSHRGPDEVPLETIEVGSGKTNALDIPPTHHPPPRRNFHIKDLTGLDERTWWDPTTPSGKWTSLGPFSLALLSQFQTQTRGIRPRYSNNLSGAVRRTVKFPKAPQELRKCDCPSSAALLVVPVMHSPLVRRYWGRIGSKSPFVSLSLVFSWDPGPPDCRRFGRSSGSGQVPVGASNQPELRSRAAIHPPSINPPSQGVFVCLAHDDIQPHLPEASGTPNNDASATDTVPEQLNFSFNPPTQPDLDPPNQRSYDRGYHDGYKIAMELMKIFTRANASSVRAESSKSPNRGVQPPSPPVAPALGLDKASSLQPGHGPSAAAPSVSGEVGLQLYAPSASPYPTISPDPGSVSGALPGTDTDPGKPQESRQEPEPGAQNIDHDHNPPTSQAVQSVSPEDVPPTSTHQVPVSPTNPMHAVTNVLQGTSSNSQGKAHKSKNCPVCDRAFRRPGELRDHIASKHRAVKLHACSFDGCGKTYGTRSNLAKHVKQKHTASAPTMPEHHIG